MIHHGDWENRTTNPPQQFWDHLIVSGIGNYYPLSELPSKTSGRIQELNVDSQSQAFEKLIETLKAQLP